MHPRYDHLVIECNLCDTKFTNNKSGAFTRHIVDVHEMSLEDYVVKFELCGIEPRCACGLCDERPLFRRGKFSRYALDHDKHEKRRELYIRRYGKPTCEICGAECKFDRVTPRKRCDRCRMIGKGFGDPNVQQKIRNVVKERYDVDNVGQLEHVRELNRRLKTGRRFKLSQNAKKRISLGISKCWKRVDYRNRCSQSLKIACNTPRERKRRSDAMKKMFADGRLSPPDPRWRLSRLHQRLRNELCLDELGFVSEQRIGSLIVDELNEDKKIIIEINGDYIHANPKFYKSDDVIITKFGSYAASEKWARDVHRKKVLEDLGYKVIVVWESDCVELLQKQINESLL